MGNESAVSLCAERGYLIFCESFFKLSSGLEKDLFGLEI